MAHGTDVLRVEVSQSFNVLENGVEILLIEKHLGVGQFETGELGDVLYVVWRNPFR